MENQVPPPEGVEPEAPESEAEAEAAPEPRRPRVLVAEDHPVNRKVIELILASLPVELVMVENGSQAVEASANNPFDVVLMDMQMPVMDGLDAARFIRSREARGEAPRAFIVFLTANTLPEHAEMAMAAGGDAHVAKPINTGQLMALIGRFVKPQAPDQRQVA
ncbi:MAG TPA: response regulator [Caulobacteraceae bacterium]|nr:response regulator [Caulobacteraceae bacterium]